MSEVMNETQVLANDTPAAVAASDVPAGTPAALESMPTSDPTLEARVVALEIKFEALNAQMEDMADAWLHFSQAGEAALAVARQSSGADAFTSLDARLKVIEASRV